MTERSLQVTYRKGRPLAKYLHLSHARGEKSARTVASGYGLLIVDYGKQWTRRGCRDHGSACSHARASARPSGSLPTAPPTDYAGRQARSK